MSLQTQEPISHNQITLKNQKQTQYPLLSKSCVTCNRNGYGEALQLTVCKDFYGFLDQWRNCSKCWRNIFRNTQLYVCPKNHFMFNFDLCIECEQKERQSIQDQNNSELQIV